MPRAVPGSSAPPWVSTIFTLLPRSCSLEQTAACCCIKATAAAQASMHAACTQVKFRQFKLEVSSLQMCVLLVVNEQKVTSMEELCTQLGTNERTLKRHVQALTR